MPDTFENDNTFETVRVAVQYDQPDGGEMTGALRGQQTLTLPSWCSGDPASGAALFLFGYAAAVDDLHMVAEVVETTRVRDTVRDDLSRVLGDAYAYRLGEAYGPDDEDLEDDDRDGLARVQRLATAFAVDID
jgi:hypothetical protein